MALNLVQLKEHRERSAAAEQKKKNYNLRGSSCWLSFKGQLQGGLVKGKGNGGRFFFIRLVAGS